MKLTKRSKLTAIITVAVMFLAIVITSGAIFAPKFYKDNDTTVESTAYTVDGDFDTYQGYGYSTDDLKVTFNSSNMGLTFANVQAAYPDTGVWIYFPTKIYMDVTEDLKDLRYSFQFEANWGGVANNGVGHALFYSTLGYYRDGSGNQNGKYNAAMTANANMEKFFTNYNVNAGKDASIGLTWGSNNVWGGAARVDKFGNWSWSSTQNGDGNSYTVTYYAGGKASPGDSNYTHVDNRMSGKPDPNNLGTFTYRRLSGSPIMVVGTANTNLGQNYKFKDFRFATGSTLSASEAQNRTKPANVRDVNDATGNDFVKLSTAGIPILDDVIIEINTYDKGPLLEAMKNLEEKYKKIKDTGLLLGTEQKRFEDMKKEVKDFIKQREVTQAQINAKKTEVESYTFKTGVDKPSLGSKEVPKEVTYTGSSYNLSSIWSGYTTALTGISLARSDCFPSGTMDYYQAGFNGSSTAVADSVKNNMVDAGYYKVSFTPDGVTRQVTIGGYTIKVVFSWSDGTTAAVTGWFRIKPADITVSSMSSEVTMIYNGNTPNTITGLPGSSPGTSATIGLKGSGNTYTVQLSIIPKGNNAQVWNGVGDTVSFADVNDAPVAVYYRISATNHNDKYDTFTVKIDPASISIKLKDFQQVYHSDLLTSQQIFEQMLAEDTPNILDATTFAETKAYLESILTFAIQKDGEGYFDPATDKPDAANYTVDAVKTTDAAWAKRIDNVSFVSDSNINAYEITPKSLEAEWTESVNKWFNNTRGHRPSVKIADGQDTFGQDVGLSEMVVLGNMGTELVSGNAVNAGSYTARVASTNDNFKLTNGDYVFSILPRKITVELQDRAITYGSFGGIENLHDTYYNSILANNVNNQGYIATLDSEIAAATPNRTEAIVHNDYKDVFNVNFNATATEDGNFYVVGEHTLEFVSLNSNYDITATDGKFTVNEATLTVTSKDVAPMVYNADYQDIQIEIEDDTITLFGYEKDHLECVKVEYSENSDGPWRETPLQIKNVLEAPKTVYCRVSAPNHKTESFSVKQDMSPVNVTVYFDGQTDTVYYGSEIPTSDELLTILHARFTVSARLAAEGEILVADMRDIDPSVIFEFYLYRNNQAVVGRNTDAGKYNVMHRLNANAMESEDNFNVVYNTKDGKLDNVEAYTISPKPLYIEWAQNGDRWTGEGKDHYIFSNSIPTVHPSAPDTYDGKENVVEGDSVYPEEIELAGSYYKEDGYEVGPVRLITERNRRNYVISNPTHTFYIDKLEVKIVIEDQTAEYGTAKNVKLGTLSDPMSMGAIWDYAQDSYGRFYSDHYSYYKFVSNAQSGTGALVDVGNYPIGVVPDTTSDAEGAVAVRGNYNVVVDTSQEGKTAMFRIIAAKIVYTGRVFNVDLDNPDENENRILKKQTLIDGISTGIKGVSADEFVIKMSQRVPQDNKLTVEQAEEQNMWVEATETVTELSPGRYHVLLHITHPQGNFESFTEYIQFNALTDWVSVIIGKGGVTDAEYGYTVHTSDEIFKGLEFESIVGIMTEDGIRQLWDVDQYAAIDKLKEYIAFRVLVDRLDSNMATEVGYNSSVGDFSLYFDVTQDNDGKYEDFRFLPRSGETDNSNINAYHVQPRTVIIDWGENGANMNEIYGDHGNSHSGYSITNLVKGDEDKVRLELTHYVDESVEGNTARFKDGHAYAAGYYIVEVIGINNSNYRIKAKEDDQNPYSPFVISPKEIDIHLYDRTMTYGIEDTHKDNINGALNIYSPQSPNFVVIDRETWVGTDRRVDIFEIYLDFEPSALGGLNYLPAGEYTIKGRQVETTTSVNYIINFINDAKLNVTEATASLNVGQLNPMVFNAQWQNIDLNRSWIVLAGDSAANAEGVKIGYQLVSIDEFKEAETGEFIPEQEFAVRDAGRYVIKIQIDAPNHKICTVDVNLNVSRANVIINMTQAEKTYGDKIDDLSDWLKTNLNITITSYQDFGGGIRVEESITQYALDDFIFFIVKPGTADGDGGEELDPGSYQSAVGDYRIYHKFANGALANNYIVEYYQSAGSREKCNARAYKIIPRPVSVVWTVANDDVTNWNSDLTKYYYTGNSTGPKLLATFNALPDENGDEPGVDLTISGMGNHNVNADGQYYTARVSHTAWDTNPYAVNYELIKDTYQYSIVKRPIKVTIKNQTAGTYGSVTGAYGIAQEDIIIYDMIAKKVVEGLPQIAIHLILEDHGVAENELLDAGKYKINGTNTNTNYDIVFVGEDDETLDYGYLTVRKATFDYAATATYSERPKYLGEDIIFDLKQILPVDEGAVVGGEDWKTVWSTAEIEYLTINSEPITTQLPTADKAGTFAIKYRLSFKNYNDFTGTFTIVVGKSTAYVSISGVSSTYGDPLLSSSQIFEKAEVIFVNTDTQKSDPIVVAISDIITLEVEDGAKDAGTYDVVRKYVGSANDNFTIVLVDNANKYEILKRDVELSWDLVESDNYVFDGTPHKIIPTAKLLESDQDLLAARFEEYEQKDQAGTYIARLISIGVDAELNYKIPAEDSFEWTIAPRPVEVDWTVEKYTYDGQAKLPTAQFKAGEILLGTSCGLDVLITLEGETIAEAIDARTYTAVAVANNSNYVIVNATQSFTIDPKQIQVEWSNDTFVYDGREHAPTATIKDGELVGDDVKIEVGVSGAQKNAGTYTASVSGLDNTNYVVVGATKSFTIEKKQVTISWTVTDFEYTGDILTPEADVKIGDIVAGDTVGLVIDGGQTNVGTYTAEVIGVTNDNYVLAPNTVKEMDFTIEKAVNEFEGLFGKGDSKNDIVGVPWVGEDKPTDKFGNEVVIKYYDDKECTKEIDINKIKDGTYWAVAYVDGTENYDALQSSPLEFTIDNGVNVSLAIAGIVVSVVLLGAVLAVILIVSKKKKGGRA